MKNKTAGELLAQLTLLSLEAPSNVIDVVVSVHGHVKNIGIQIILDCSVGMYINGNQPEPITHVNFNIADKGAEKILRAAIITVQDLMLKHNEHKDAA